MDANTSQTQGTQVSKGTTRRTVRIEDGLWEAALTKAAAEDRAVSDVIRELLKGWVANDIQV